MKKERLDKVMAHLGLGSRSEVKTAIATGKVSVNGQRIQDPGFKLDVGDLILFKGEEYVHKEFFYFMMNKSPDCISATEDPREITVIDKLSERHKKMSLFPVGRLDKETEGLLLLTTDGPLAHRLTSPKHHIEKEYYAEIDLPASEQDLDRLSKGVVLDDGYKTAPANFTYAKEGDFTKIKVILQEGKFRQIRRMFQTVGKEVLYLKRIRMGNLHLDTRLSVGTYRELTEAEIQGLKTE